LPDLYVASPRKRIEAESLKIISSVQEKPNNNPLSSFIAMPSKINFETQGEDEQIILLLRQHWIINVSWILIAILMIASPLVLRIVPLISFLPPNFQLIALVMWYLVTMAFVFEKYLSWFFNVYIITDERIIDVDFLSLTYREISEAQIEKIQDITYKTGGLIKDTFDFGDVYIQTAGEVPRIEFIAVPKPDKVVKILNQLLAQEEQEKIEGRVR
jgi:membrane protein YdbS with pleckstrin-like domain